MTTFAVNHYIFQMNSPIHTPNNRHATIRQSLAADSSTTVRVAHTVPTASSMIQDLAQIAQRDASKGLSLQLFVAIPTSNSRMSLAAIRVTTDQTMTNTVC
jgi:hypothetical protein